MLEKKIQTFSLFLFILFLAFIKTAFASTEYAELNATGIQEGNITTFGNGSIYSYRDATKTMGFFTPGAPINRVEIPRPTAIGTTTIDCTGIKINTPLISNIVGANATTTCVFYAGGSTLFASGTAVTGLVISDGADLYNFYYSDGSGVIMDTSDLVISTDRRFLVQYCTSNTCTGTFDITQIQSCSANPTTRITNFDPQNDATTTSPVTFNLDACIDPDDIGDIAGVSISLHNIDQNVLLLNVLSPNDIMLLSDRNIQVSGDYNFSTTTTLGDGNYRLEACVNRAYLFGFIVNPLSDITECVSHQFIVGSSTFIGNVSQRMWGETNDFYAGLSATSSEAMARTCNPVGLDFGVRECMAFLFIPDASDISATIQDLREGVLTRFPWGYATRFVDILVTAPTTTLPTFTVTLRTGAGSDTVLREDQLTFDPGDMISGGASLLSSIEDPYGNTLRDATEPLIRFGFATVLIIIIAKDLMAMNKNDGPQGGESRNKSSLS